MSDLHKQIFEVNQWLKRNSYSYDFEENLFLSNDGQSDIFIKPKEWSLPNPGSTSFIKIENGNELYTFLNSRKGRDSSSRLNQDGLLVNNEDLFPFNYTSIPLKGVSDLPSLSTHEKVDCTKAKMFFDEVELKSSNILIDDIIQLTESNKKELGNEFLFLEIDKGNLCFFSSKLDLPMNGRSLICLNNFFRLKNKRKDSPFLDIFTSETSFLFNYGNTSFNVLFSFKTFNLSRK